MGRNKAWRIHQQNRIVKRRILNAEYRYYEYRNKRRWGHTWLQNPEDKWFNYLGEYTRLLRTSSYDSNIRWWNEGWKAKYNHGRAKFKRTIRKELNDEIGETYYISH